MTGALTVILILAIISTPSLNYSNFSNNQNPVDNQPIIYTPIKPNLNETQKPQIDTIAHTNNIRVSAKNSSRELKSIDWGSISIGQTKYYDIEITNKGSDPVTLRLSAVNWTPGVEASIDWLYNGSTLAAGDTLPITLCLTVNSASSSTFDNDVVITSTSV